jgi:uncharacterized protein (TIRG00374 family)
MGDSKSNGKLRRILLLLLMLAFPLLIVTRFTNLSNLVGTLVHGKWYWILAAIAVHLLFFTLDATFYHYSLLTVDVQSKVLQLLPLRFASIFINAILPSGGAGAVALFVDDASRRGESGARTAVGMVLALIADLGTLAPFVVGGLIYLDYRNALASYNIAGSAIFFAYIAVLALMIGLARWEEDHLHALLQWVRRIVNRVGGRFNRPDLVGKDWPRSNAHQFAQAAGAIVKHPKRLGTTLALGVVLHLVNLLGLYTLFLAYAEHAHFGTAVAGFSIGIVFWVVTFIPQAIGAVEGVMLLIFTALGMSPAEAGAITVAFRGVNFWLPIVVGFLILPRTGTFSGKGRLPTQGKDDQQQ